MKKKVIRSGDKARRRKKQRILGISAGAAEHRPGSSKYTHIVQDPTSDRSRYERP